MKKVKSLAVVLCLIIISPVFANASKDKLWQKISETNIPQSSGERRIIPDKYGTFRLNASSLQREFAKAQGEILLPYPDGSYKRFQIQNSPVMEPALAAQFPDFQTFNGKGIDEPAATAKLDWTSHGFHAMVFSPNGTLMIDPYRTKDVLHYISYYKKDLHPTKKFECLVHDFYPHAELYTPSGGSPVTLRTYRLAVGATGEYTQFHGGTVNDGLAAITTSLNRIDGIYEREFAVHMNLVANETNVIFTNPATDPYSDGNGGAMLGENQNTMDSIIGNANYDIAHVFGAAGGGGIAGLGVVCGSGSKAWGVSSLSPPEGDTFDVDYVSHEMGHQYSGNHSFNGTTGSCNGNRNGSTAWEVGSGSTIMCYAGICGAEDLQPHSDDYFHTGNFSEMFTFVSSGGGSFCAQLTPAGHSTPTSDAGANYTIPQSTPFVLTGSGSDPDGDSLTYNWEEFDLGAASPPNGDNGNRPIFRSFDAVAVPQRTFPQLSDLLNNTQTFGEWLPTTNRTMQFKLSVRDNHPGAGGQGIDTMQVTVSAGSGPFLVTQPNTAVTWNTGTQQQVTWDVAGTSGAPVNSANVDILLSTDGGNTFPTVLASNTPNDGTEMITVPSTPTTTARVKVAAVGNIFFD
ncbi:MAG TPA: zinc-dependent metalloprotease family protein, partial [Acidobacteriota bacterium]